MRRALLILLALLLPLKAIGAVVVPITGAPHHHHTDHAGSAAAAEATAHPAHQPHHEHPAAQPHAAAHGACDGTSGSVDADPGVVHEHSCPHLGMATMAAAFAPPPVQASAPCVDEAPARPFASIVLEILVPPPTLIA